MKDHSSTAAPILAVLGIVLVLPGATYAVAYFASVQRGLGEVSENICTYDAGYRFGGNARVFEPMHLLDRHWIRPEYWRETIE